MKPKIDFLKVYTVFGLFIILYNPPILPFNAMHLIGFISIVFLLLKRGTLLKLISRRHIFSVCGATITWFLYLCLTVFIFNHESVEFVLPPLYFLVDILPFGLFLSIKFRNREWGIDQFIELAASAGLWHGAIALAAFIIPSFHNALLNRFIAYGNQAELIQAISYRFFGFASGLTHAMPVLQTMLAVLLLFFARENVRFKYLKATVLFLSAIINARTSLVVGMVGILTFFFLSRGSVRKKIKYMFGLLLAGSVVLFLIFPLLNSQSTANYKWIVSGFSAIVDFLGGDSDAGYFSYVTNAERYRLPSGIVGLLFGKGHITMGMEKRYGYYSDVGYINDLWLGGFVYIVFLYSYWVKLLRRMISDPDKMVSFFGMFMLILYPILNFKGVAVSADSFSYFTILFYLINESSAFVSERKGPIRWMN